MENECEKRRILAHRKKDDEALKQAIASKVLDTMLGIHCYICGSYVTKEVDQAVTSMSLHTTISGIVLICPYCDRKIQRPSNSG